MVRQREFDTDQALEAAMIVFWEKGFEAASLRDLTIAMGIQRPSLYAAFGDKNELFEATLRHYNSWHASQVKAKLNRHHGVKAAFRQLFEEMISEAPHKQIGCFCINTMVELAPHDPKFEVLTREHQMYLAAIFQKTIEKGQKSGELSSEQNAKALAYSLVVSMIGLTVIMKSKPDQLFMKQSIEMAISLLDDSNKER